MALSYLESGNNTASSSWGVSYPNASAGDLLIFNIGWDDSTTTTGLTPPSGPNGESAVVIEDVRVSSSTAVRGKIVYYVATGTWTASTLAFTPSASEQWSAVVVKVPAGEFDATTPIGADNYFESTTTDSTPDLPSLTAGSTDGGGTVVGFMVGDVDDADGTITGWTSRASTDRGAVGVDLWTRNTTATDSESISAATGATYPSARDYVSFIYIIRVNRAPTVALNSPADASSDSDTTPTLDFTGTDANGDSVRYEVEIGTTSALDLTDSSDTGGTYTPTIVTANRVVGGNGTPGLTQAAGQKFNLVADAFVGGIKLNMKKVNTPTDSILVELCGSITGTALTQAPLLSASSLTTSNAVYTFTFDEIVKLKASTDYFIRITRSPDTQDGTNYITVGGAGTGGTFTRGSFQYKYSGTWNNDNGDDLYFVLQVTPASLIKVSGGSLTTETITSSQNWIVPLGVTSITVEAWGAGGGGGGDTTTGGYGGGGGAGGGYSKSTGISVTPGTSYSVVVGTGGAGGANAASPGVGGTGGDSTFNSTTVVAKGGTGGAGGTSGGASGGTGGASGSGTGDTKTSGGNGGTGATLGGGGGGGSGGDSTGGGTGGNASVGTGGTAGSAGTTNGSAGGAGGNSGGNGSAGTAPGGGGGGSGNSAGSGTAAAGAAGQVKITYTPGDAGFANPDNGGDTDPFNSGENIQFTVQAGDALSDGTYYWRVRALDPSGSNEWGAWSSTRSFTVTSGGGAVFSYIPQRMRRGMGN